MLHHSRLGGLKPIRSARDFETIHMLHLSTFEKFSSCGFWFFSSTDPPHRIMFATYKLKNDHAGFVNLEEILKKGKEGIFHLKLSFQGVEKMGNGDSLICDRTALIL